MVVMSLSDLTAHTSIISFFNNTVFVDCPSFRPPNLEETLRTGKNQHKVSYIQVDSVLYNYKLIGSSLMIGL